MADQRQCLRAQGPWRLISLVLLLVVHPHLGRTLDVGVRPIAAQMAIVSLEDGVLGQAEGVLEVDD